MGRRSEDWEEVIIMVMSSDKDKAIHTRTHARTRTHMRTLSVECNSHLVRICPPHSKSREEDNDDQTHPMDDKSTVTRDSTADGKYVMS